MAFDEGLAQRLREQLAGTSGVAEKKMFGGLSFLVDGNLCVGVMGEELIARVGLDATEAALGRPGSRLFDFSGRPMKGWITVDPNALEADDALAGWVDEALRFVRTLPPK
ncbi:MAG TPA: TfoX/Sxy family protein [Actinomycetes bacterium]|jgi:TfoX/Sxy family transcriptional regulator of competence genes|nr:TfoX/Sxy family protein [Actinomycetes bacterium]